jgi:hypothetical protein
MSITAPTIITTLPPPPSTASPADFDAKADAFLGGLPTLRTEINNISTVNYNKTLDAATSATAAATQAGIATTQASAASVSAANAAASTGAAQWVSGTTYAIGTAVWSPITFAIYRRLTAGAGTTDPSADATNWGPQSFASLAGPTFTGNVGIRVAGTTALDVNGTQVMNIVTVPVLDIVCSSGNYFIKTIAANSTFTISGVPASRGYGFMLELTHTSGTVTWPASIKWSNDTAPVLTAAKTHLFTFITDDGGTRWRGSAQVNFTN